MSFYRRKKKTRKAPAARNKEEKCVTRWCRNRRATQNIKYQSASGQAIIYKTQLSHCWKCRTRMLLKRHPATYCLNMLRHSAKNRKLPFTLTLVQFKQFCVQTGYLERRGQTPDSLTIDRIDATKGYHIDNIRVLTHEENSAQGADNIPRQERGAEPDSDNEPF
jgi:hypothetical protein